MEKLKKDGQPPEFLTPMNKQKPGKDPMPDIANFTDVTPPDPMGFIPPGHTGTGIGSLTGHKKGK